MGTSRRALFAVVLLSLLVIGAMGGLVLEQQEAQQARAAEAQYVVLSWNDLGMHCYNRDFQDLAVLPPYNSLWAQVVKVGDPPEIVTSGVRVAYSFPDNTYSVGKSNFWQYDQQLFGVDLPPDVGLKGKGLSGDMDRKSDHFVAEGIPLTEFRDSDPVTPYPYQLAEVVAFDEATDEELARSTVVAPVSTEMRCDNCHYDGGVEEIATGRIETNILTLHDKGNMDEYPPGLEGALMDRRPILCAECHASNALAAPGQPGIPSLSKAMHEKHAGKVPSTIDGCYQCHPGPQTQCLRDVMSTEHNMECTDCHGGLEQVSQNPNPWLNEPRCDNEACHGSAYAQDHELYRESSEHGGLFCAACHDSPHAIAPGREANDAIKFVDMQGFYDTLQTCTVCHLTQPQSGGPHGASPQHNIPLHAGWNIISTYRQPVDPAVTTLLAGVKADMVLMKNGVGEVYWPAYDVNQIGKWEIEKGYQVYMKNPAILSVTGNQVDPAQTPIALAAGWNMVAYLRASEMPVSDSLASISGELYLVKNADGQVYWPEFGINDIGNMQTGQGYKMYMNSAAVLTYPDN
jgi:hypothetical protein